MSARDIELMERARLREPQPNPDRSDAERAEAIETAMRRSTRLRERIVDAAEAILAEEGYDIEDFLEE